MKEKVITSVLKDLYIVFIYQYLTYGLHFAIVTAYDNNFDTQ